MTPDAVEGVKWLLFMFFLLGLACGAINRRRAVYRITVDGVDVQGESERDCERLLKIARDHRLCPK